MGEISESTIDINNFIKVFELKGLYLLYLKRSDIIFSKTNF
ncbi:hypothetical protein FLACHUCJ7_01452 [Flavobacterium chungangense]|uniref:Uncharacterized protein n=1 Tax=Flavobacterium chungangense TaxID=554283 RepID=A0A6V6YVH7_9FLAO|nr:hypothetical protein FLACHUCJ7_01452 [Flavobacterium chungangense]